MDNLVDYAQAEFEALGWVDSEGRFNDPVQESICHNILDLLIIFGRQGHSGTSGAYALDLFTKLAKCEPLGPLTGDDSEWRDVSEFWDNGTTQYQNRRYSSVFKDDTGAYDTNGIVWYELYTDSDGVERKTYFTDSNSRVYITFPYTPKTEYKLVTYKEDSDQ